MELKIKPSKIKLVANKHESIIKQIELVKKNISSDYSVFYNLNKTNKKRIRVDDKYKAISDIIWTAHVYYIDNALKDYITLEQKPRFFTIKQA